MPNLEDLKDQYEKVPRIINQDLRSIVHERGETRTQFPTNKLVIFFAAFAVITWFVNHQWQVAPTLFLFVTSPLTLGIPIAMIRASSPMVQLENKLRTATLLQGRVVEAANHLHRPGNEAGLAYLVFAPSKPFDEIYLKDPAKQLRSALQAKTPPSELTEALQILKAEDETTPVRLPETCAGEEPVYLAAVKVNPARLPKRKINNGMVPLLVNLEGELVVHV